MTPLVYVPGMHIDDNASLTARLAEAQERIKTLEAANASWKRYHDAGSAAHERAEKAEDKLWVYKIALEEIRDGRKPQVCAEFATCQHEGCNASYLAFAIADIALKPTEQAESETTCIVYPKTLPNRPTCVWLSDGMKIGIQREGGAAWLRIEKAATVQTADTAEQQVMR